MPTSTITVAGQPVTLVPWVTSPAPKMVEPWVVDSVAVITSVFTGKTQRQGASGADLSGMTVTYAPLTQKQAAPLLAWLRQMRGLSRATQLVPPEYPGPHGTPSGTPLVNGAHVAGATTLVTKGWTPGAFGLLLPDDLLQIGYRLHCAVDTVTADGSGNATFEIFPSLRDDLADGTAINASTPMGLYGLASNRRNWSVDTDRYVSLSFALMEYR